MKIIVAFLFACILMLVACAATKPVDYKKCPVCEKGVMLSSKCSLEFMCEDGHWWHVKGGKVFIGQEPCN